MFPDPRLVRRIAALFTACAGFMNILSALYPAVPIRMELLRDVIPIHVIRGSQTLAVLTGFLLVVLADGLIKRRRRALHITVGLLLLSVLLNLVKGLDFEEATVGLALAAFLSSYRAAFDLSSRPASPVRALRRVSLFLLLYYGYVLTGFIILRRFIWPQPTLWGVTAEPFNILFADPSYHYISPHSQWFERTIAVFGALALIYAVLQILRPLLPRTAATPSEVSAARDLVRRHGGDALSYFALQDGRSYFFHPSGGAVLSYKLYGSVALVGGDPIGPPHLLRPLVSSFLDFADANALDVCFLGSSACHLSLYADLGLRTLKIGEEAVIDLPGFDASILKRKVRRAARHIEDLGITAHLFTPATLPQDVRAQMEAINRAWIEEKGGAQKGFSMTLGRLPNPDDPDCDLLVAMEGDTVWGYISIVPIYSVNGRSLDAMRRRVDSPNGLMEHLVIRAAQMYRERGYHTLSLNFATLSNSEDDIDSRMVESTRRFLYENLSSLYQLKSLQQFNSKFMPRWCSRYMAYRGVLKFPKLALAIVQSEDPIRLPSITSTFTSTFRR